MLATLGEDGAAYLSSGEWNCRDGASGGALSPVC